MPLKDPEKRRQYSAMYREKNRERLLENNRKWQSDNRDWVREYHKSWRKANPEIRKEQDKRYRRKNKAKIKEYNDRYVKEHPEVSSRYLRKYRETHREIVAKRQSEYKKRNPDIINAILQRRRARKRGSGGSYTTKEWSDLKERYGNICLRCGVESDMSPDHIVSIKHWGRSDIDNIQPLCRKCNSIKNYRDQDYILLKSIDEAVSVQSGRNFRGKTYEDIPWWNLWENIRYEE